MEQSCLGCVRQYSTWTQSRWTLSRLSPARPWSLSVYLSGARLLSVPVAESIKTICPVNFGLTYVPELWAQRWTLGQLAALPLPAGPLLFRGRSCTFLSSECVNLYTWCENSSINVYQENGTKTKKRFFLNYSYYYSTIIIIWVCKLLIHLVNLSRPHLWKQTDEKKRQGKTKVSDKLF